jgi:hypothetical protein
MRRLSKTTVVLGATWWKLTKSKPPKGRGEEGCIEKRIDASDHNEDG